MNKNTFIKLLMYACMRSDIIAWDCLFSLPIKKTDCEILNEISNLWWHLFLLEFVCSFNLNQAPYFVDGISSAVSSSHFGIRKRNMKWFSWAYMRTQGFKISKYFKKIAQCNAGFNFEKFFKIFLTYRITSKKDTN